MNFLLIWGALACLLSWLIPLNADTTQAGVTLVVGFRATGLIALVSLIGLYNINFVVPRTAMEDLEEARKLSERVLPGMLIAWAIILIPSIIRIAIAPPFEP